jgi:hypothetical protein
MVVVNTSEAGDGVGIDVGVRVVFTVGDIIGDTDLLGPDPWDSNAGRYSRYPEDPGNAVIFGVTFDIPYVLFSDV